MSGYGNLPGNPFRPSQALQQPQRLHAPQRQRQPNHQTEYASVPSGGFRRPAPTNQTPQDNTYGNLPTGVGVSTAQTTPNDNTYGSLPNGGNRIAPPEAAGEYGVLPSGVGVNRPPPTASPSEYGSLPTGAGMQPSAMQPTYGHVPQRAPNNNNNTNNFRGNNNNNNNNSTYTAAPATVQRGPPAMPAHPSTPATDAGGYGVLPSGPSRAPAAAASQYGSTPKGTNMPGMPQGGGLQLPSLPSRGAPPGAGLSLPPMPSAQRSPARRQPMHAPAQRRGSPLLPPARRAPAAAAAAAARNAPPMPAPPPGLGTPSRTPPPVAASPSHRPPPTTRALSQNALSLPGHSPAAHMPPSPGRAHWRSAQSERRAGPLSNSNDGSNSSSGLPNNGDWRSQSARSSPNNVDWRSQSARSPGGEYSSSTPNLFPSNSSTSSGGGGGGGGGGGSIGARNAGASTPPADDFTAPFAQMPWFYATITRPEAESLLAPMDPGAFVVRKSSQAQTLALTFKKIGGSIGHGLLQQQAAGWCVEGVAPYHTHLSTLLEQHKGLRYALAQQVRDTYDRMHSGGGAGAGAAQQSEYVALPATFGNRTPSLPGMPSPSRAPPPARSAAAPPQQRRNSPIGLPVFAPYRK